MKCEVKLYVAGQQFSEIVEAVDYSAARQTALARNPTATVVSVNAVFDKPDSTWADHQTSTPFESSNVGSGSGNEMSVNDILGLCILGGGIWAFIVLTPWIFLGAGATLGGFIGKWVPKYKALTGTILAFTLGITGYVQGENLQNWFNSDSITERTEQISFYS